MTSPMPPGLRPDLCKRIADLIVQLKRALIAREQARIEAEVDEQLASMVVSWGPGRLVKSVTIVGRAPVVTPAKPKRKPWSAAAKKAAADRMKAHWKKKREGKAPVAKAKK